MDPKKFRKPQTTNRFKRLMAWAKDQLGQTQEARTKRIVFLKDISIFVVSVGAFIVFENRIKKILSVDPSELQKLSL